MLLIVSRVVDPCGFYPDPDIREKTGSGSDLQETPGSKTDLREEKPGSGSDLSEEEKPGSGSYIIFSF